MPRTTESSSAEPDRDGLRLQKYLARSGVASRRHSEILVSEGRVRVNGEVVTVQGVKVVPGTDVVEVDGERVELPSTQTYLVLNKPAGYVTTMSDPQGRPTVRELLPDTPGLVPVGRLDRDTTGVLLAVTDGELTHRLLHPTHHVAKVYRATVEGTVREESAEALRHGVELDDGPTLPADVEVLDRANDRTLITLTLREGRKRQVKRMCAAVGHPVLSLHRTSFGPVADSGLEPGEIRPLTDTELAELRTAAGLKG